jgi:hypothetical protein
MTNTEGNKISQPHITAQDSNAEYIYIIEDKEVWFIDYIIGIAFKTPIDFRTIDRYGICLLIFWLGNSYPHYFILISHHHLINCKTGEMNLIAIE